MLDPRKLHLLRELARRGTIAAVAEAVTFTPSAVSQQLSALEREAGVRLLERTGRTVALTPAGHLLVEHAQAVLEQLERASAALAAVRGGPSGPLRIGAFPTAARVLLPPALATLTGAHPGLEPMVSEIDPADVSAALRAGELDVALVHEYDFVPPVTDASTETEPLFTEPMYLTDRPSVAAARADAWIMNKPGTLCHTMAIRACQAAGLRAAGPPPHRRLRHGPRLRRRRSGRRARPRLAAVNPPRAVRLTRLPLVSARWRRSEGATASTRRSEPP